ncbi:unnamed protein product [Adineta steineri]|uniref:EF-hand domain-containing protein n=1 Tax=Adineta steineri TaxID=433720 RepID=A0A818KVK6_9BILA|nr:unnamed protein product [Adineta steineri]CAF1056054.1 unnamed protein product [Adineta steineri]CAF3562601.1 unnamed protein product [Adineta steineri]CAF3562643.1 unnamed protein product [Adineta steineri]
MSKSFLSENDSSSINERDHSWKSYTKTYFNNSKQLNSSKSNISINKSLSENYCKNLPGAMPISMNQILQAQNTNAPWLFNILKKKFHRSRKYKKDRIVSFETDSNKTITNTSNLLAEELLEQPISCNGTSGIWIVSEKDITFPLIKDFEISTTGQYNISRAMSSSTSALPLSTDDSLHIRHYQYDFQTLDTPITSSPSYLINYQSHTSSNIIEEIEQKISNNDDDTSTDFTSIASMIKTYYTTSRQQIESHNIPAIEMLASSPPLSSTFEPIIEDHQLASGNSIIQTTSKRAKSTSAARSRRTRSSTSTTRGKKRSDSTKKKKSKYYQEHLLTSEEIELREALRIIDLDNIGFFSPSEFRKVLKEIGINPNDIQKIERCLPLDEDGHYSVDNLIKLFLGTK